MALINCKECGIEISDKAYRCPKCGCPIVADEVYSDEEKEICTVKYSIFFLLRSWIPLGLILLFALLFFLFSARNGLNIFYVICLIIVMVAVIGPAIFAYLIYKNTSVTLTNKRVIFKFFKLYGNYETDYPLRQINHINVDSLFGIYNLIISTDSQWFKLKYVINAQQLKNAYFDLIENKYKY